MRFRHLLGAVGVAGLVLGGFAGPALAAEEGGDAEISHEAELCIEILEKGGEVSECQEAPNPILPATNEIVFGGLSFLLLFALLYKVGYPAVQKAMDTRASRIRENLDEAERTRAEAQTILEDYQRQLADARNEANRIIEEARQTADQLRRDLMQRAEAEVAELRARAQEDIEAAKQRAIADLRGQVAELAVGAAEKIVERSLDREAQRALVESYINQVGARS